MTQTLPGAEPFSSALHAKLVHALGDGHARDAANGHGESPFVNRLALESSPYLRQHARNPVNWYAWGNEAFAQARRLGRPLFLSVGYTTCHWCHVMERESFEDEGIAAYLNAHYVAVKVDREERPDVDAVYMRAAQAMQCGGGWPLSVWLNDAGEPFFAGTYFPPHAGARGAAIGFLEILTELVRVYHEEGSRTQSVAHAVANAVRARTEAGVSSADEAIAASIERDGPRLIASAVALCQQLFDEEHGGLRLRQKFPSQVPIRLLLRHHQRTGDAQALRMATRTLEAMAAGGLYDHLAGGFHRYATDPEWRIPHFEKMLYDNAQLVVAYAEAWQVTQRPAFARVARETCDELLATFVSPEEGFYSATDADSEGEEGKYFAWSEAEIRSLLGPSAATEAFLRYYGVTADGNFELGNVLYEPQPDEETRNGLAAFRANLLEARRLRVPPFRDEKILAAWNGLAISAFAVAGRILGEKRYVEAAARAADFVLGRMRDTGTGGLVRSFHVGRPGGLGFLDDYAFVVAGLLDLFESTGESRWFVEACALAEETERIFADNEAGGWFATGLEHEHLIARHRPTFDGAEPAGSSVALLNAERLAVLTDSDKWRKVVARALAFYWPLVEEQPLSMTEALLAVDFWAGPVKEIVLVAHPRDSETLDKFTQVLRDVFCPRKVLIAGATDSPAWAQLRARIPLLGERTARGDRTTAYLCTHGTCQEPTSDPETLQRLLSETNPSP
jgi:hypothetical protein